MLKVHMLNSQEFDINMGDINSDTDHLKLH